MTLPEESVWEKAQRCYKCDQIGIQVAERQLERHQGKVITIECGMKLCPNFGERWIVQIKPDGTIPTRKAGVLKSFPEMTEHQIEYAKRDIANSKKMIERGDS